MSKEVVGVIDGECVSDGKQAIAADQTRVCRVGCTTYRDPGNLKTILFLILFA